MKCFMSNRDCEYEKKYHNAQKLIFMISPYGYPFDDIYQDKLNPLSEKLGYKIERADQALQLGFVMCQRICKNIQQSEYVFADISLPNSNVYYELGLSYGLGKKIVLFLNKNHSNDYVKAFDEPYRKAIIEYEQIDDFDDDKMIKRAMDNALCITSDNHQLFDDSVFKFTKESTILNITNEVSYVKGLHEDAIRKVIEEIRNSDHDFMSQKDLYDGNNPVEWKLSSLNCSDSFTIKEFNNIIQNAKICIIDTTHYNEKLNVYIYFCLGLAHALERDVIPIVNSSLNKAIPFDIRGLWQISFQNMDDFRKALSQILREIYKGFIALQNDFIFKEIWDPFIINKKLCVMTCARKISGRAKRAHIDTWDFLAVSHIYFFIAHKYKYAAVETQKPQEKVPLGELVSGNGKIDNNWRKNVIKDCEDELRKKERNYIILGSPESSDYAEVVLSKIHSIEPYTGIGSEKKTPEKEPPFLFYKGLKEDDHPRKVSSFYRFVNNDTDPGKILWYGATYGCERRQEKDKFYGITFGVLTIARNPYCASGPKVMVLSGYSGIATYGIIQCLINENYRSEFDKLLKKYSEFPNRDQNFLIKTIFDEVDNNPSGGEARDFKAIEFLDAKLVHQETSF